MTICWFSGQRPRCRPHQTAVSRERHLKTSEFRPPSDSLAITCRPSCRAAVGSDTGCDDRS